MRRRAWWWWVAAALVAAAVPRGGADSAAPASGARRKKAGSVLLRTWARRRKKATEEGLPPGGGGATKRRKKGRRRRAERMKERTDATFASRTIERLEVARRMFLDRMAAASVKLIERESDATTHDEVFHRLDGDDDDVTPQSDLTLPGRSIYVVTTAALPWRTGTAVNPLLRAAYLSRRVKEINAVNRTSVADERNATGEELVDSDLTPARQMVTLVIPWLELEEDRLELYGPEHTFASTLDQEKHIREWLRQADMKDAADPGTGIRILFYPARYHADLKSIFAMGDICAVLRNQTDGGDLADAVCILEEPDHLNWYRAPGEGWTKVFDYVVGILHTNYVEYAGTQFHGLWTVSRTAFFDIVLQPSCLNECDKSRHERWRVRLFAHESKGAPAEQLLLSSIEPAQRTRFEEHVGRFGELCVNVPKYFRRMKGVLSEIEACSSNGFLRLFCIGLCMPGQALTDLIRRELIWASSMRGGSNAESRALWEVANICLAMSSTNLPAVSSKRVL